VAVPRVWEKMQEKMEEAAAKNGPFKRALVNKELPVDCTINILQSSFDHHMIIIITSDACTTNIL